MKIPMTSDKFNKELRLLVGEAMQDNKMSVFEILGSLSAAQMSVDRIAVQMSMEHQAKEMQSKIIPSTTLPVAPKN